MIQRLRHGDRQPLGFFSRKKKSHVFFEKTALGIACIPLLFQVAVARTSAVHAEGSLLLHAIPPVLAAARKENKSWWRPEPGTSWQWQLSGTVDTSFDVVMYDIDLFDTPQTTIDKLHNDGRIVICYMSAGSYENWRPDEADYPEALIGKTLNGWPDEKWVDIRQLNALGPVIEARLDLAVEKKCDGIEPDNIDGYSNDSGFPLTPEDQLAFNRWLVKQAHARGLSIGLKNDLDQIQALVTDFDWALNEQCFQYNECTALLPFVQNDKAVFGVEYEGNPDSFCPQANAMNFNWLKKNLNLDSLRQACR